MTSTSLRRYKNRVNRISKKLGKFGYYEDCSFHVCKVESLWFGTRKAEIFSSEVEGRSLFDGHGSSCSLVYCGPLPLKEHEALARVEFYKEHGFEAYLDKFVYAGAET